MAHLSDVLLQVAVVVYLAAMTGYLVEYAFGTRGAVARVAGRREKELVTAGAPVAAAPVDHAPIEPVSPVPVSPAPATDEAVSGAPMAGRAGVFGAIAVGLTLVGLGVHIGVLVSRGLAADRVPWGNMYEFVITLTAVGALGWLVLLFTRPALRPLGLFVTAATAVLLGFAGLVLATPAAPLVPALNSYWLKIHVTAAATASGLLLLAFIPAALFLIRSGHDGGRRRFPYPVGRNLPAADTLERLTFRLHTFAFPIWTLAVICGAIWAEAAWGRYWGWDPKETWSFISWVAYAAYLHARATPSVKRTTATWFAVAAWGTMLINLYVINFVAVGLHSYAK
ncbi:MAG: c-type cytochrome biogenesis protein CcsB [Sporichthyaceae bacterium]|nr:c-type cytochrome biogenesis protein CcsB [Sporichthyaceae bacterium]